jgi:cytidyltransferase-like protein
MHPSDRHTRAFVGGSFDGLHPGHIRLLEFAKESYDDVVVGLNCDYWITQTKGYAPSFSFGERKELLEALGHLKVVENPGGKCSKDVILLYGCTSIVTGSDWMPSQRYFQEIGMTEYDLTKHGMYLVFVESGYPRHNSGIRNKFAPALQPPQVT